MRGLLELAAKLTDGLKSDVRVVGGLAVRLHVGTGSRVTRDVDLVPLTDDAERALLGRLSSLGFLTSPGSHWRRAVAPATREIVDVLRHPIVDPKTFEASTLRDDAVRAPSPTGEIPIVGLADLVRLKLLAGRDQDMVDLMMLAVLEPSARRIAEAAELDELERAVSRGAHAARHALASGEVARNAEELLGRPPSEREIATLRILLDDLLKAGL